MTVTAPGAGPLLIAPKIEVLVISYLTPYLTPTPVATRMPQPDKQADTINGLLRVEAAGGVKVNYWHYDMTVLLHAYHPDEDAANGIANQAVSLMSVARGQTINNFYIVTVENADVPKRQTDPDVILPRYLSTVTWRVAGQPWTAPAPP